MSEKPLAPAARRPAWQLPPGVAAGTWEYVESVRIAETYDRELGDSAIFQLDEAFVKRLVPRLSDGAVVLDLGCGTGRSLLALAGAQRTLIGVDLSRPMLHVARRKANQSGRVIHGVHANMVDLDCFRDEVADCILCLFSSFGMVRGRANRRSVLRHVARLLRPDGFVVLHAHNRYAALRDPGGFRLLLSNWLASRTGSREFGDRVYPYRGLAEMFLHSFSSRELRSDFRASELRIESMLPLNQQASGELTHPHLLSGIRAGGWLIVARRGERGAANNRTSH